MIPGTAASEQHSALSQGKEKLEYAETAKVISK
jgi:hypothetical protein